MKGLRNIINGLQKQYEALEAKVANIEEKRDAIEDNAIEHDRDMTDNEQLRYEKLDEQIDELNYLLCDLESLINGIKDLED